MVNAPYERNVGTKFAMWPSTFGTAKASHGYGFGFGIIGDEGVTVVVRIDDRNPTGIRALTIDTVLVIALF